MQEKQAEAYLKEWRDLHERSPRAAVRRLRRLLWLGQALIPAVALAGCAFVAAGIALARVALAKGGANAGRGGGIAAVVAFLGAVILFQALRAWWGSRRDIGGARLDAHTAPLLHERIGAIADRLGCRVPDRLFLHDELDASTVETTRAWIFGRRRLLLRLGLPLFELMSPDELESVVAHELAHQGGDEFGLVSRVARVRAFWSDLATRKTALTSLIGVVARWYSPRVDLATLALARRAEFDADAAAARAVGRAPTIVALKRTVVASTMLPKWYARAISEAARDPSRTHEAILRERSEFLRSLGGEAAERSLAAILRTPPDPFDHHPTLAERLAALGESVSVPSVSDGGPVRVRMPSSPARSALVLLGDALSGDAMRAIRAADAIVFGFSREEAQRALARLGELDRALADRAPSAGHDPALEALIDEWLRVSLMVEPSERSVSRARRAVELRPDYGDAWAPLARLLLDEDDPEGVSVARHALELGTAFATGVTASLAAFHDRRGDARAASAAWRAVRESSERDSEASEELDAPPSPDSIEPHRLGEPTVAAIRAIVSKERRVARAWLVRRRLANAPSLPVYLVLVRRRVFSLALTDNSDAKLVTRLLEAIEPLQSELPGPIGVLPYTAAKRKLRRAIVGTADSQILPAREAASSLLSASKEIP